MLRCEDCGNTDIFLRIYDATITVYVDSSGEESSWEERDVSKMDDDYQEQCNECGSHMIEEAIYRIVTAN